MQRKKWIPFLLLLPALSIMFFLMIFPVFWNFSISLHDVKTTNINNVWPFVGFQNWVKIFQDEYFLQSLKVTLFFVLGSVFFQIFIGFLIARILIERVWGTKFFRVLFILPWLLSATIVGFSWQWMYNDYFGLINGLLIRLGMQPVNWISDPNMALISLLIANIWFGTPFSILFQESSLLTIDRSLYEAAKIDGANPLQSFFNITLPLLAPFLGINLILTSMWSINLFDLQLVLTGGGPLMSTTTASLYMYKQGFDQGKLSIGATIGLVLLIINLIVSFLYLRALRGEEA
ncbi:carbohydrate ABC transporter permease [Petrotoga olearia]|uniref:ABC transporter permease n=2 Tax=Petrotoga olearia TaxID=156203 RepID=A0A2K1NZU5_9BACT|nr:sugar ABC transporter permease [Petrotoga olearia]PNR96051.1 ABC transporter permease [Petrotoga olearia DSM 13574]RMA71468.1 carbohydrate ABC transporter membrane protein 1 (CUT1 family) [Petrotoga olearia]